MENQHTIRLTTFEALKIQAHEANLDVHTMFSVLCSNEQAARLRDVMKQTKNEVFFSVEGEVFKGNRFTAIIKYILAEPEKADFYVWCRDNCERYVPE